MNIEGYILKNNLPIKPIHIADILASGWASTGSATAE
jgi:L-lactate dehydrogenase complex protein LldE